MKNTDPNTEEIHWRDAAKIVPGGPHTVLVELDRPVDPDNPFSQRVWLAWYERSQWHLVGGDPHDPVIRWAPMPKGGATP